MYSSKLTHLIMATLSVLAISNAAQPAGHEIEVRQQASSSAGGRTSTGGSSPSAPPSSSSLSTSRPTSSSVASSSSTVVVSTPASSTAQTSTAVSSSTSSPPPPTSSTPALPSSTTTSQAASTTAAPSSSTTSSAEPTSQSVVTFTTFTVVEATDPAGQKTSVTSALQVTSTAALSQNSTGGTSGITDSTRNIIIGVTVGVGGAIILGVVALLVWRLRSKRRQQVEHDDMAGTSAFNHTHDKSDTSGSANGRTPFQSNLEQYHAPTQTNTASNF